jgi:hypothetical protein
MGAPSSPLSADSGVGEYKMLRLAGAMILLTAAIPAHATNWTFVDSADTYENITFIDKDGIRTDASGITVATMFSVFATDTDGASAYRFNIEVNCTTQKSRLVTGQMYDTARAAQGEEAMQGEWETVDPGSQGATITKFVCSKGAAYPNAPSSGAALPFDKGKEILAKQRAGKGN